MNTDPQGQPPWPHHPPIWTTCALLASLVLGVFYCWAAIRFSGEARRSLFPLYAKAAFWSSIPGYSAKPRTFTYHDHVTITKVPAKLYGSLQTSVYGGTSIPGMFVWPAGAYLLTLLILVALGARRDTRHGRESRDGQRLRGPRMVTPDEFNHRTHGDGLEFDLR